MIRQKMVDQKRSDLIVVYTIILCKYKLEQPLIALLLCESNEKTLNPILDGEWQIYNSHSCLVTQLRNRYV